MTSTPRAVGAPLLLAALCAALLPLACSAAALEADSCFGSLCLPQQVHLAHGRQREEDGMSVMTVTWNTVNLTLPSVVEYGAADGPLSLVAQAEASEYVDGGAAHFTQYVYRATMEPLQPGGLYRYRVGNDVSGWSDVFSFVALRDGPAVGDPLRFIVYGDLGDVNARSVASVETELLDGRVDSVIHIGDYAYDLFTDNAAVGDRFMNDIQPIAANVGYMGCVGNHEAEQRTIDNRTVATFASYKARFTFPGNATNQWYSWNAGPVHFVAFSTELYFFDNGTAAHIPEQWDWLVSDLEQANRERDKRPWIITYAHRPMYCGNNNTDDCTFANSTTRNGIRVNGTLKYGFEDLLYDQGVDLSFFAHEHSYERLASGLYHGEILESKNAPYVDPLAPVQITAGSAGCRELHDPYPLKTPFWSAFHTQDYGYGVLEVYNGTTLKWMQKNEKMEVIDEITVVASKHGPRSPPGKPAREPPARTWRDVYGLDREA